MTYLESRAQKRVLVFAVYCKLPLYNNFSFSIEPQFIQKKFYYRYQYNQSVDIRYNGSWSYINIPFLIQAKIKKASVNPFVEIGLFLSVVVDYSEDYVSYFFKNEPYYASHAKYPLSERLSETGALVGLGFEIPVSEYSKIIIGYRYSPGLSDIATINSKPWRLRTNILYTGIEL